MLMQLMKFLDTNKVQTVCGGSQGTIFLRNNIRLMNWGLLDIQI